MLIACDNNKTNNSNEKSTGESIESTINENLTPDESPAGKGTYTSEGRTYTGGITTETNAQLRNLFTVTCKSDMIQMIELHFKNEEVARKGGSFKPGSQVPEGRRRQ